MAGSHIAIPTILKIGKGTLNDLGKYISASGMKNAVIYFGNGLIDMFGQRIRIFLIRIPLKSCTRFWCGKPCIRCF